MEDKTPPPAAGNGTPSKEWFQHVFGKHPGKRRVWKRIGLTEGQWAVLLEYGLTLPGSKNAEEAAAYLVEDSLIRLGIQDLPAGK